MREAERTAVWRMRAWWLFVGLLAAALITVVVVALVTSHPSMSFGGPAPVPSGLSRPAAPYPDHTQSGGSVTMPGAL
jgi:hypothetical protein